MTTLYLSRSWPGGRSAFPCRSPPGGRRGRAPPHCGHPQRWHSSQRHQNASYRPPCRERGRWPGSGPDGSRPQWPPGCPACSSLRRRPPPTHFPQHSPRHPLYSRSGSCREQTRWIRKLPQGCKREDWLCPNV